MTVIIQDRMAGLAAAGIVAMLLGCTGGPTTATDPGTGNGGDVSLQSEDDRTLYAIGLSMGGGMEPLGFSADELRIVQAGFGDAASGHEPRVDLQAYGPQIRTLMQTRSAAKAEAAKSRSRSFIDEMAKAEGAETTPSGLVYIETEKGSGASPAANEQVTVHYRGSLTDGTEFDSSHKRGQPATFMLSQVIPCWIEGLQKMAVGGKAKLICPSDIAYGDTGRPPTIGPGATLVFEVELLGIGTP